MPVQLTPSPEIPGGYSEASRSSSPLRYVYMSKQSAFDITVNGLLPSTLHYLFFEKQKVDASNYKPKNGKLGDPIFTDRNGQATFTFYYNSPYIAVSTEDIYNEYAQRIGGDKQLVLVTAPSSINTLPDNYLNAFNSIAVKNIYFKTTKASELPVSTEYSFAYPSSVSPAGPTATDDTAPSWDAGGNPG